MKDIKELKEKFNAVVADYIAAFEKKQNVILDYWVGDRVGETGAFGDFYFDFDDIRYDIDNNIKPETIFLWFYHCMESQLHHRVNYQSWCKGMA